MAITPEVAPSTRRCPIGAEVLRGQGTHFRVWAPRHSGVTLIFEDESGRTLTAHSMQPEPDGYFSLFVPAARAGALYRYRLGSAEERFPDPASRFQPFGPHGPSQIVDPLLFKWTDASWRGVHLKGQVLYEMHVGTFTQEGTWTAAAEHLPHLADVGITTIEMMPIAEFGGDRGWGYDGVDLFAPTHLYGVPDDLRRFVDMAHGFGLAVILDVVYNHFGPDGNFLHQFSSTYFTKKYDNEWGEAINFDEDAAPVRELITANAEYWIRDYHLDGLRLDATQQIFDATPTHVLAEVSTSARDAAADRSIILVAENERQDVRGLQNVEQGGFGLDGLWNDDFHHSAKVALAGRREAYFTDYSGSPQEFVSMAKWGFLYQGQRYSWQRARRGTPSLGFEGWRFITYLDNHDQIANAPSGRGERLHQRSSPGMCRAVTALWLLLPGTPMFFQGQEFAASAPFLYFVGHTGELAEAVRKGRAEFMSQFRTAATQRLVETLPDPSDPETFARCKLRHDERARHRESLALHRDLLTLRREDPILSGHDQWIDGAVLSDHAFIVRWFAHDPRDRESNSIEGDRLVVVNLGADVHLDPAPEPLLAPPPGMIWDIGWSSEDRAYGGIGTAPLDTDANWRIPGQTTVLLVPRRP